ncbi:MAG: M23 family metallopeptidase, partial [Saprospiraceae bacterium]|nr:M23 family metallopeptidase [Saprospiraceae bacterium]
MKTCLTALLCVMCLSILPGQIPDTVKHLHVVSMDHPDCDDCAINPFHRCMDTPEQEAYVDSLHQAAMDKYVRRPAGTRMPPSIQGTLTWPLQASEEFDEFSYYAIGNYGDLDTVIGDRLDYSCGARTYDTGTFNHDGTDISTYPFPYHKMANDLVEVVAVAPGTITVRIDGNPDMNCVFSNRPSNRIKVAHADGTVAEYKLFKNGSVTSKLVGQTVAQGEYLGIVASSGSSTAPHLHVELRDSLGEVIDPFFGPCSGDSDLPNITTASWWADQKPYVDSMVNALITHSGTPVFSTCDMSDSTAIPGIRKAKKYYEPGDSIVFGAYYRNVRDVHTASVTIYRPDNSIWMSWDDDDAFTNSFHGTKSVLTPA